MRIGHGMANPYARRATFASLRLRRFTSGKSLRTQGVQSLVQHRRKDAGQIPTYAGRSTLWPIPSTFGPANPYASRAIQTSSLPYKAESGKSLRKQGDLCLRLILVMSAQANPYERREIVPLLMYFQRGCGKSLRTQGDHDFRRPNHDIRRQIPTHAGRPRGHLCVF